MQLRRWAAALVMLPTVGLASACSSGGGSVTASGSVSVTTPTTAATATTLAVGASVHATAGGAFCGQVADGINSGRKVAQNQTPALMQKAFEDAKSKLHDALGDAPSDIRADLNVLFNAEVIFGDAMVKANWDFTKVDPNSLQQLQSPQFQQASQHLSTWVKAHCGIDLGASTP